MKRATAIVLALVLAVSLFTACSSGSSRASSGARYKAGTYTVTVDGRNGPPPWRACLPKMPLKA